DLVGVRESGFLAGDRTHPHALFDRVGTVLDDTLLHRPALAPGVLEVQVPEIDSRTHQRAERPLERTFVQSGGPQQAAAGDVEGSGGVGHDSWIGAAGAKPDGGTTAMAAGRVPAPATVA